MFYGAISQNVITNAAFYFIFKVSFSGSGCLHKCGVRSIKYG